MIVDLTILFDEDEIARKPQQARSLAKQEAIFKAAAALFVEKGYNHTNTKDIAALAGVSIGTLYFQFIDKRQILLTMLANQIGDYVSLPEVDPIEVQKNPCDYFSYQMKLAFPYSKNYYSIVGAIRELNAQDEKFRHRFGLLRKIVLKRVYRIMEIGQAAGMTHNDLAFDHIAQTVTNAIFNFYSLLPDPNFSTEDKYWARHKIASDMICRVIFRDEFC